jgi:hypothetical protein
LVETKADFDNLERATSRYTHGSGVAEHSYQVNLLRTGKIIRKIAVWDENEAMHRKLVSDLSKSKKDRRDRGKDLCGTKWVTWGSKWGMDRVHHHLEFDVEASSMFNGPSKSSFLPMDLAILFVMVV